MLRYTVGMAYLTELLTDFMQHKAQDPTDPRRERREPAKDRLANLEKKAEAVHAKILKVYPVTGQLQSEEIDTLLPLAERIATKWKPHRGALPLWGTNKSALRDTIQHAAMDYFAIYALAGELEKAVPQEGYEEYDNARAKRSLLQIHANHLTNAAEARFIAQGMDAFAAHRLNGFVIRETFFDAVSQGYKQAGIAPAQKRPEDEQQMRDQLDELRGYWQGRARALNEAIGHQPIVRR